MNIDDTIYNLHKDIIPKLKFISKINKGDKINVKNMYIQPNNMFNKIIRSFFLVDDRTNTLMFVNNTVKKGFELFHTYAQSKNPFDAMLCQNILQDLKNAKIGLLNLKETYASDVMFICKIDALIEEIDAKIIEVSNRYHSILKRDVSEKNENEQEELVENEKNDYKEPENKEE